MTLSRIAFGLLLGGAALGQAISVASADQPEILGVFKDWTAYKTGVGDARVCYALSKPIQSEPRKLKRDAPYFLINDWPGRNAKAEPEIVPGYVYKEASEVTAQVGSDKFQLFTKNDGGAGGAWVEAQADEARLIDAMKAASQATVTGTSKRGTMTRDTYSLAGLSDALDKVHQSCGM
jgi:hypothetical protein